MNVSFWQNFSFLIKYIQTRKVWIAAILLRLFFSFTSFHAWELHAWVCSLQELFGGENPYSVGYIVSHLHPPFYQHYAYLPLYLFVLVPFYILAGSPKYCLTIFNEIRNQAFPFMGVFFLKLPSLLSDFAIAFLLFLLGKEIFGKKEKGLLLFSFWLMNPYAIFMGSVWGHIDPFVTFLTVLSFFFLLKERYSLSALSLGLAISSKTYPIFILPVFLLFILRKNRYNLLKIIKYSALVFLVSLVLSLPFLLSDFKAFKFMVLDVHLNRMGGGLTFWNLIRFILEVKLEWNSFSLAVFYRSFLFFVFFLSYLTILRLGKSLIKPETLVLSLGLILVGFYISSLLVNETFFLWALPFLLIAFVAGHLPTLVYHIYYILPIIYAGINNKLFTYFFWRFSLPILEAVREFFEALAFVFPNFWFSFMLFVSTVAGAFMIFLYVYLVKKLVRLKN